MEHTIEAVPIRDQLDGTNPRGHLEEVAKIASCSPSALAGLLGGAFSHLVSTFLEN
jgi:hypothetical protein